MEFSNEFFSIESSAADTNLLLRKLTVGKDIMPHGVFQSCKEVNLTLCSTN
jgi:hypothetical protein